MLYWIIYLIDVITPLKYVFILLSVVGFVATVASLTEMEGNNTECENCKETCGITKYVFTTTLIFILLAVFIPSKTTAYTLLGIKLGQVAVSKPEVQNKVDKLSKIIDIKLDQYIQEEGSKK